MTMLFPMLHRTAPAPAFALPNKDLRELINLPPIDVRLLTEQCLGNLSFAITLLDEFEKTAQERVEAIESHAAKGNFAMVGELAHSLKGVVGILGADALWDTSSALQAAAHDENVTRAKGLIPQLRQEMKRVLDYIPTIRAMSKRNQDTLSA